MASASISSRDVASPSWLRPRVRVFARSQPTFLVCALTGLFAGFTLSTWVAVRSELDPAVVAALLIAGVTVFVIVALTTKVLLGVEALIFYHHELAVLGAGALLLLALEQPLLRYLDVTAIGLGLILAFGRIGCLMVGCCHGRPHWFGVRYGRAHVQEGFPACYQGVPLFPVQALECACAGALTLTNVVTLLHGAPPGAVLAMHLVAYGAGRFALELLRGDPTRPYFAGLSEAQWTSAIVVSATLIAESRGMLPWVGWHLAVPCAMLAAFMATRMHGAKRALVQPRHVYEIAGAVSARATVPRERVEVSHTSLGIGISCACPEPGATAPEIYSMSRISPSLSEREAGVLAELIRAVASLPKAETVLVRGGRGVFHLLRIRAQRS